MYDCSFMYLLPMFLYIFDSPSIGDIAMLFRTLNLTVDGLRTSCLRYGLLAGLSLMLCGD